MPLLSLPIHPDLMAWEITEEEETLKKQVVLDEYEQNLLHAITRQSRRKELLAARILLQQKFPEAHIHYQDKKPILRGASGKISISNSQKMVVIQLCDKNELAGVDIQYFSDKVLRVKHKFLHPDEWATFDTDSELILNLIWSAKETLYKAYSQNKLEFKKQIAVCEIDKENRKISGWVFVNHRKIKFQLGLFLSPDFVITWFLNSPTEI